MSFELPALPYAKDALAPHISAETTWNITTVNTTRRMSLTSTT